MPKLLQDYSVLLQYYFVLQSTTPVLLHDTKYYSSTTLYYKALLQYNRVLLCTTKYYSSTTPYYKVLLQYYSVLQSIQSAAPVPLRTTLQYSSVLQSTTPVLLRTTKYFSSTTPYYKVPVLYYSVLQSTPPVLLRATNTKYHSSTSLYYKVLLQYHSVLQSTTPVLLCATKYYSRTTKYYFNTTLYYKVLLQYYSVAPVLLCTTKYYSSATPYYKMVLQHYSVLQSISPVLLRAKKYYASTTPYYKLLLQYHSVLLAAWTVAAPHALRMKEPHEKDCECSCERYPQILKTPKVEKAMGNLKCWMALRVNRGFDNSSYEYVFKYLVNKWPSSHHLAASGHVFTTPVFCMRSPFFCLESSSEPWKTIWWTTKSDALQHFEMQSVHSCSPWKRDCNCFSICLNSRRSEGETRSDTLSISL